MKTGKPVHPSTGGIGIAPDAATTPAGTEISFDKGANRNRQSTSEVIVTNMEVLAGNTLEISFDGGHLWFAVAPRTTVQFPVCLFSVRVRGTTGAVAAYSVMGIIS